MTDHNKTRREMDEIANGIFRLQSIVRLTNISNCRITDELIKQLSICQMWPAQMYYVGSKQEGFPDSAIGDVDTMICMTAFPIVLWKSQEKERGAYVIAEQNLDHHVYLRLKVVDKDGLDEDFKSIINKDGYLKTSDFIKVNYSNEPYLNVENYKTEMRHGPSIQTKVGAQIADLQELWQTTDLVFCLKCQSWPPFTSEFFTRERQNNWPSQLLLDKVKGLECHVVPVGYPGSESDVEWRLSLSIAERELITEMYDPYANCMLALKLIKKKYMVYSDSVKPTPFCSYFIKTACLWMCETFPHMDYSVMDLIRKVLDWIIDCYQHKRLPHYFIPQHNLIGHLSRECCDNVRETLTAVKRNLWINVLSSDGSGGPGYVALNIMCDTLNVTRNNGDYDYLTLENILLNHPEATAVIEHALSYCLEQFVCSQANHEMELWAVYYHRYFTASFLELMQKNLLKTTPEETMQENQFENIRIPEKIILPIVEHIEEIVPKGYGEMFKTRLYRYLGDIYTHFLVWLENNDYTWYQALYFALEHQNTPLHYYDLGAKMDFPDNHSDHGIGGKVLVVKYHYIMGNYKELKQRCDSILLDCCLSEKNCRLASLKIIQVDSPCESTSIFSGWAADEILHYLLKCSSELLLFCHPILLVLYIKARVLLTEGDTENALNVVIKMKERKVKMDFRYHETTKMFITIIESLVGLLGVMRRIYLL